MEALTHSELFSLWIGIVGLIVGLIGIGFSIYQFAIGRENKKRKKELQYIIAGMSNLALSKSQSWINQTNLISQGDNSALDCAKLCVRARDDFSDIHSLATALEKTIDVNESAITEILNKTLEQTKINNQIQEESLKNPTNKEVQTGN